jgi:predicted metal-dependent HD superfamily phosphohydrolase
MQELLDKWNIKIDYKVLLSMWNEPHRSYHSQNHLIDLVEQVNESKSFLNSQKEYEKLIICSLFHDCIYDPMRNDNEEKSAEFFMNCCQEKNQDINHIYQMIIDTKEHKSDDTLSKMFNHFDMNIVERDFDQLLEWESGIKSEYEPVFGIERYKEGRLKFLESLLDKYPNNTENLLNLIECVKKN